MPQKNTKRKLNYNSIRISKNTKTSGLRRIFPSKWIAIAFIAIIASIGSYFVFFSEAAPNNCQNQDGVPICDVDLVSGLTDAVIGVDEEPARLGRDGWGWYFGPAFRAPIRPLNGAVPIYRVYNHNATLHDWVTGGQKAAKEAKYEGVQVEGVPFYAWDRQVPGTVPVYRLSRGGTETKILLTSDKAWIDRTLAVEANDPNGWRQNQFGEFIAFYAYPPGYTVPGTVNPGDCGNPANLANPECKTQRESLEGAIGTDALPTSNECPATIDKYLAAAFPSQFSQACQDKWNNFAKDCSKQENFLSDRCKTQRAQLEAGLAERAAIEAAAKAAQSQNSGSINRTKTIPTSGSSGRPPVNLFGGVGFGAAPAPKKPIDLFGIFNVKGTKRSSQIRSGTLPTGFNPNVGIPSQIVTTVPPRTGTFNFGGK